MHHAVIGDAQARLEEAAPPGTRRIRHALTVDVEDWYHGAEALGAESSGADTRRVLHREDRVEANLERLVELFDARGAHATFFFLGEVAERFPSLVRRVAHAGHEIASHGYHHLRLSQLLSHEFRADVQRSIRVLEDITGRAVGGYRAPCFSIKAGVRWPLDVLQDLGVTYDSSLLAIDRPPGLELVCPRRIFRHHNGLWEVPVGVLRFLFFWHLPLASGAGLRLVPPFLWRRSLERFERDIGAGVFYLHPWELDVNSPSAPGPGRWIHRIGRHRLLARLDALLREGEFGSISEVFPQVTG